MTTAQPVGNAAGLRRYWGSDLLSGFLVFLIALPLCLGISLACGYPAIAGIFTAIIGGVLSTFFSNSELTIKGPAAGLIVIAIGCVTDFGFTAGRDPAADFQAYRLALGVGVVAGLIQTLFGVFRAGILGEFFPSAAVHGLLASIGVIIIAKQVPVTLGLGNEGSPLELLAKIPTFVMEMNPQVGLIGIVSLVLLFGFPLLKRVPLLGAIPAPVIVLIFAVPMGMRYGLGGEFLVNVPSNMFGALTFPDFSGVLTATGVQYIVLFSLIGSLESLLSAKAVDEIDPYRRKTNYDGDLLAVGVGNTLAAFVGGLPMISEIVRSKANIDNGAKTRFANMFHGLFLLVFVALAPGLINQIPLAALGAMLVFTGFRLASPKEFAHMYHVGREQLVIFVSTILGVLATDLLSGIAIGILVKALIHVINGAPVGSLFRLRAAVEETPTGATVAVQGAAVFSTWIGLKKRLAGLKGRPEVTLDLSGTRLVDHTVMDRIADTAKEFEADGSKLVVQGLDEHRPLSGDPAAARVRKVR
ncbi:MAG: SulP family inorganic anion transporter [Bryobacterales bacterium]|nr:SulP family inorganic anion transporter [Bryobacterales bacterium]